MLVFREEHYTDRELGLSFPPQYARLVHHKVEGKGPDSDALVRNYQEQISSENPERAIEKILWSGFNGERHLFTAEFSETSLILEVEYTNGAESEELLRKMATLIESVPRNKRPRIEVRLSFS